MKHFFILAAAVFLLIACEEEMKPPSGSEEQPPTENGDSTVPDTDPTPEPVTARVSGLKSCCTGKIQMMRILIPSESNGERAGKRSQNPKHCRKRQFFTLLKTSIKRSTFFQSY